MAEAAQGAVNTVTPGPHRSSGPVCDRPSASRPVPPRQNRPQPALRAVLTGQNGPGRARTVANRAGTALTGAVRTGRWTSAADTAGLTPKSPTHYPTHVNNEKITF